MVQGYSLGVRERVGSMGGWREHIGSVGLQEKAIGGDLSEGGADDLLPGMEELTGERKIGAERSKFGDQFG